MYEIVCVLLDSQNTKKMVGNGENPSVSLSNPHNQDLKLKIFPLIKSNHLYLNHI